MAHTSTVPPIYRAVPSRDGEVLVLDQGSSEGAKRRLDLLAARDRRVRVHHADRDLGEGAGRNALLRIARGRSILGLDPSVELVGPLFTELESALAGGAGIAGPWGLRTTDLNTSRRRRRRLRPSRLLPGRQARHAARDRWLRRAYRFYRTWIRGLARGPRAWHARDGVGADHAGARAPRVEALSNEEREKRSRKNHGACTGVSAASRCPLRLLDRPMHDGERDASS